MDLLPIHDFITSCNKYLENIGLLHYEDLSYFDTFHYTNQKVIFVNISSDLIIRVFKHREAVKHPVEDPSFLNSNFCLRAHSFHWQEILSVVFLKWQSTVLIFKKNVSNAEVEKPGLLHYIKKEINHFPSQILVSHLSQIDLKGLGRVEWFVLSGSDLGIWVFLHCYWPWTWILLTPAVWPWAWALWAFHYR